MVWLIGGCLGLGGQSDDPRGWQDGNGESKVIWHIEVGGGVVCRSPLAKNYDILVPRIGLFYLLRREGLSPGVFGTWALPTWYPPPLSKGLPCPRRTPDLTALF